jgi:hypothetical protein
VSHRRANSVSLSVKFPLTDTVQTTLTRTSSASTRQTTTSRAGRSPTAGHSRRRGKTGWAHLTALLSMDAAMCGWRAGATRASWCMRLMGACSQRSVRHRHARPRFRALAERIWMSCTLPRRIVILRDAGTSRPSFPTRATCSPSTADQTRLSVLSWGLSGRGAFVTGSGVS